MLDTKGFLAPDGAGKHHQEITDTTAPANEVAGRTSAGTVRRSHHQPNPNTSQNPSSQSLPDSDELDRIEIQLRNGKKAYLLIPVPLPYGEKIRLKGYIDLLLEEKPPNQNADRDERR